jgi:hypothetical protein
MGADRHLRKSLIRAQRLGFNSNPSIRNEKISQNENLKFRFDLIFRFELIRFELKTNRAQRARPPVLKIIMHFARKTALLFCFLLLKKYFICFTNL